jgi:hypothetical protein
MADVRLRYLFFGLLVIAGLVLPLANILRAPFLWYGLSGINSELQLSRDRDREIMLRELEEMARKADQEGQLKILREFENLFPPEERLFPAQPAPLIM